MAMPEKAWPFCIRSILSKMLCENCVGRIVQCGVVCMLAKNVLIFGFVCLH